MDWINNLWACVQVSKGSAWSLTPRAPLEEVPAFNRPPFIAPDLFKVNHRSGMSQMPIDFWVTNLMLLQFLSSDIWVVAIVQQSIIYAFRVRLLFNEAQTTVQRSISSKSYNFLLVHLFLNLAFLAIQWQRLQMIRALSYLARHHQILRCRVRRLCMHAQKYLERNNFPSKFSSRNQVIKTTDWGNYYSISSTDRIPRWSKVVYDVVISDLHPEGRFLVPTSRVISCHRRHLPRWRINSPISVDSYCSRVSIPSKSGTLCKCCAGPPLILCLTLHCFPRRQPHQYCS